jgi:hypothetical protein
MQVGRATNCVASSTPRLARALDPSQSRGSGHERRSDRIEFYVLPLMIAPLRDLMGAAGENHAVLLIPRSGESGRCRLSFA